MESNFNLETIRTPEITAKIDELAKLVKTNFRPDTFGDLDSVVGPYTVGDLITHLLIIADPSMRMESGLTDEPTDMDITVEQENDGTPYVALSSDIAYDGDDLELSDEDLDVEGDDDEDDSRYHELAQQLPVLTGDDATLAKLIVPAYPGILRRNHAGDMFILSTDLLQEGLGIVVDADNMVFDTRPETDDDVADAFELAGFEQSLEALAEDLPDGEYEELKARYTAAATVVYHNFKMAFADDERTVPVVLLPVTQEAIEALETMFGAIKSLVVEPMLSTASSYSYTNMDVLDELRTALESVVANREEAEANNNEEE